MAKQSEFSMTDIIKGIGERLAQSLPNLSRYQPHPKQLKFHQSDKRGRLYIGGNRAGKTIADVTECCWWLTKTHPFLPMPAEPVRGRLVCVDFLNGLDKIILPLFKQWLPDKYLIDNSWDKSYDKEHKTLTLANGSFIEFMSYDQDLDKFAGTSRHFVAFDEEPPKNIWNECRARLVDTGGSWWISMTPVDGMTWVYDDIYEPNVDNKDGKWYVIQADMLDNPHISRAEAEEFLSGLSEAERRAREKGEFVQMGGRVFKSFDPEIHKTNYNFVLRPDMRIYTSIDIGWRHPTAWLWHAVEPSGHITTFHEMVEAEVTIEEWAKKVNAFEKELKAQYPFFKIYMRTGDPALKQTRSNTGTSDITEYSKHGLYIGVDAVPRAVDIGIVKIEQYLKRDDDPREAGRPWYQYTPNCEILEKQMLRLRWATYASKKHEYENAPKKEIHKKDDDAPDSLRYFMTLMPSLSFDISTDKLRTVSPDVFINSGFNDFEFDFEYQDDEPVVSEYTVYSNPVWDLE